MSNRFFKDQPNEGDQPTEGDEATSTFHSSTDAAALPDPNEAGENADAPANTVSPTADELQAATDPVNPSPDALNPTFEDLSDEDKAHLSSTDPNGSVLTRDGGRIANRDLLNATGRVFVDGEHSTSTDAPEPLRDALTGVPVAPNS